VRSRGIGFVFQHYALFKHMTIHEHCFWSRLRRAPNKIRQRKNFYWSAASGLWRSLPISAFWWAAAVALARTLAVEPQVLLLDDLWALDAKFVKNYGHDIYMSS